MNLKNGMIIKCNSKEEAQEFIKEAYKQGFKWVNHIDGDEEKTQWYTGSSEIYYYLESNKITWSTGDSGNDSIEYSTLKEKIKTMTKSDLKNGMVVELRNGKRFLIVNDRGFGEDSSITINGFMGYDENLNDIMRYSEFDIIKIYKTEGNTFKTLFDNERLNLILEREEKSKLSEKDKNKIVKGFKAAQKYCKKQTECRECEMRISGGCMIGFDIKGSDLDKLFED